MSDENDYDDDDGSEEKSPAWYRKQIREANQRVAEAEERATQNETAARRVAFQDAKIPDTPQTRFFRENYQGEWTAEAIRSQAQEYGFADSTDAASAESAAAVNSMSEAAAGGEGLDLGTQAEMEREMDEAVAHAPKGQEAKVIGEVWARYNQNPVDA